MKSSDENVIVGERLKRIRKALRIKQKDMAKTLGYSASNFCEIESGAIGINTQTYINLSNEYNINVEYLLNGRGGMFYKSAPEKEETEIDNTGYTFDSDIDSMEKLVSMMHKSAFFKHSILALAQEFFVNKEELIRKTLNTSENK
jgi:transcriptional regulator with XRE-family HTH domain